MNSCKELQVGSMYKYVETDDNSDWAIFRIDEIKKVRRAYIVYVHVIRGGGAYRYCVGESHVRWSEHFDFDPPYGGDVIRNFSLIEEHDIYEELCRILTS